MRFAYADPPYLGCCGLYQHSHGDDGCCWDDVATHAALIDRLNRDFTDGWALSLHEPSLKRILGVCPDDVRVCAWVKPFASFKPNVGRAHAWEPVIIRGGRSPSRDEPTVRDFVSAPITLRRGFTGAKPDAFCAWLFSFLGLRVGDDLVDLFHGSGAVSTAWEKWRASRSGDRVSGSLL